MATRAQSWIAAEERFSAYNLHHMGAERALRVACLWSRHATPGYTLAPRSSAAVNHFVSHELPRWVSYLSAQSTYTAPPVTLVASPKNVATPSFVYLRMSCTDLRQRTCAICHLSRTLIWEYNIPEWLAVARHVARGVRLKSQSGTPSRPA